MKQPAVSDIENGRRDITLTEALIICRVTRCTLRDLTRGAEPEDLSTFGLA